MPSPPNPSGLRERVQYGALPFRRDMSDDLEYLLISSRETGRWVIPKGWPKKGRPGWRTAEEEAYEEAGILGRISQASIGRYRYIKWMPDRPVLCSVTLFPLRVEDRTSVVWGKSVSVSVDVRGGRIIKKKDTTEPT